MAVLELNGPQRAALRAALVDAFPDWFALKQLVSDQLDLKLPTITGQFNGLLANADDLITHRGAAGHLAELVIGALHQQPDNPKLQQFVRQVGLSAERGVPAATLEKIVSANAVFLDVAKWRRGLVEAEWRLCRVDREGCGVGTGFLVGRDLVLTNYHVVEAAIVKRRAAAPGWSVRFDHKLAEDGQTIVAGRVVPLAADWLVDCAPHSPIDLLPDPKPGDPAPDELDYALLRLAEPVGAQGIGLGPQCAIRRGHFELSMAVVDWPSRRVLAILQHPLARPMKLALGVTEEVTTNGAGNRIRYQVPTEPGSSGSPVFDGDWNLIALHHSGDPAWIAPRFNEGIPIAKIAARPKVAAALAAQDD